MKFLPINIDRFSLTNAVNSEDTLYIMRRVPRGVEDDDARGRHQIHSQAARFRRNHKETRADIRRVVEGTDKLIKIIITNTINISGLYT